MTAEYTEDPRSGYFNCWSGRHPKACVRTLDLYMAWRDGEAFPLLAEFPHLGALIVPSELMTSALAAEAARTDVRSLAITMHEDPDPPAAIFELPRLESLDLSGCCLGALPDEFAALPGLADVDLSQNNLTELPPSLLAAPRLRSLDVAWNQLAATPVFPRASRLERLDIGGVHGALLDVAGLPRTLTELRALASLEVVPDELAALTGLRKLALGNKMTDLPDLQGLTSLAALELAGKFSDDLWDRLPASLEHIEGWGSHRIGLTRVPAGVGRFTQLRSLNLCFERLTELAPELLHVPLVELRLSSTTLADTPSYAYLPATLQVLHLAHVGMTRCPPRLSELRELRELVLTNNPMPGVPDEVRALPNLHRLEFRQLR